MHSRSKHRVITFTGCWTCKARKIRCDENPGTCYNCEKKGITCGGYGIRLQWMPDPFAQPDTSTSSVGQGRRRINLDIGQQWRIEEIDSFLSAIDNDVESVVSSCRGPFSMFPVLSNADERTNISPTPLEYSTDVNDFSGKHYLRGTQDFSLPTEPNENDTPRVEQPLTNSSSLSTESSDAGSSWGPTLEELDTAGSDIEGDYSGYYIAQNATPNDGLIDQPVREEHVSEVTLNHSVDVSSGPSAALFDLNPFVINHLQHSNFGDVEVDALMSHYMVHVADVLQPILHPDNPYRTLYFPAALEGALIRQSDADESNSQIASALYHAVLASAAFHAWNCNNDQSRYHRIGVQHRYQAIRSLRAGVNSSKSSASHKSILMAMLSLVTIGVISGDGKDFGVHLSAINQLRRPRRQWKAISNQTRQLNEISAFLTLIARTMTFNIPQSQSLWNASDSFHGGDAVIQTSHCYEYLYGITPTIAAAIQETCRLAEIIAQLNYVEQTIPEDILEACEVLGDKLLGWTFETETTISVPADNSLAWVIFKNDANAWYHGALIYYYRRIQGYDVAYLKEEIAHVFRHMNAADDARVTASSRTAPITWPMFIASCECTKSMREPCREWWQRVQGYGIANIKRQWDIVQQIWERGDSLEKAGATGVNWIDIYSGLNTTVLPI